VRIRPEYSDSTPGKDKGSYADIVVFDPGISHVIQGIHPQLRVDYSLFEGRECLGSPVLVMQRGHILVEDGELKTDAGRGRFIPRRKFDTERRDL
jgi:dihydropyrimidinase